MKNIFTNENNQPLISHIDLARVANKRKDNVKRTIETLADSGVIAFTQIEDVQIKGNNRRYTEEVYYVNERDSYIVTAQLSPIATAQLVDEWMMLKAAMVEITKAETLEEAKETAFSALKECREHLRLRHFDDCDLVKDNLLTLGLKPAYAYSMVLDLPCRAVFGDTTPVASFKKKHQTKLGPRDWLISNSDKRIFDYDRAWSQVVILIKQGFGYYQIKDALNLEFGKKHA